MTDRNENPARLSPVAKTTSHSSLLSPAARHANLASPAPPSSPDCNIIIGGRAIAHWLGLTYEQVRPLIDDKTIPTFKLPGHTKRCALKSVLNEAFAKYAQRRPIANADAAEKTCGDGERDKLGLIGNPSPYRKPIRI